MYKVTLTTSGNEYKTEAKTIELALDKMGLSWNNIKAKGVVKIDGDDSHFERLFNATQLRRLFGNKLVKILWATRLKYLLKCNKPDGEKTVRKAKESTRKDK